MEFKPKWLSQSPSAPPSAIRCRQCAKELYSYVSDPDPNKPLPTKAKPCPLTLGRDEYNLVRAESAYRLLPELEQLSRTRSINGTTNGTANGSTKPNGARTRGHHRNNHSLSATLNLLRDEPALKMLRAAQERYDKVGPLQASESDEDFSLAMTLRDCTCLAQIQIAPDGRGRGASDDGGPIPPLKTRFVDFDMKSSKHRLSHWREAERKLIDGGFYTARRILCRGRLYAPPTKCVLELERGDCTPRELIHIVDEGGQPRRPEGEWSRVYDVRTTDEAKLQQCLEMGPATPVSS